MSQANDQVGAQQASPSPLDSSHFPAPIAVEHVVWKPGELEFTVSTYITDNDPPDHLVTSVRCIVLRDKDVLTLTERDGRPHILPGGRREVGESSIAALKRELQEETNIDVVRPRQIGLLHFEHLKAKPSGYPYPYPHFLQLIFLATAPEHAEIICEDEWAVSAAFQPIALVLPQLTVSQRALLEEARTDEGR